MLALGLDDKLPHFRVDLAQLPKAVDLVLDITRKNYPALDVPFHSRWRHFVWNGEDRWASLDRRTRWPNVAARARAAFDLAIVSVLLDAGAGLQWQYRDPVTGQNIGRSEGLALASLAMFAEGAFSSDPKNPLQADAQGLAQLADATLTRGFQVTASNPLVGVEGRGDLLRRLGTLIASKPDVFGRNDAARPGGLFDHYAALAVGGGISAPTLLSELLRHLGPIWPSRLTLGGVPLGDCWRHSANDNGRCDKRARAAAQAIAMARLLADRAAAMAGLTVTDIDGLTGLAEYRNGGLFIDTGVLRFAMPGDAARGHDVASALVVEWRALTVALLDKLADAMRHRLSMDAQALPLAKVLEGGTWAAGRVIARATPRRRLAADQSHQRRHCVLKA